MNAAGLFGIGVWELALILGILGALALPGIIVLVVVLSSAKKNAALQKQEP